jgi:hypothetical protein
MIRCHSPIGPMTLSTYNLDLPRFVVLLIILVLIYFHESILINREIFVIHILNQNLIKYSDAYQEINISKDLKYIIKVLKPVKERINYKIMIL